MPAATHSQEQRHPHERGFMVALSADECAFMKSAVQNAPDVTPNVRASILDTLTECHGLSPAAIIVLNRVLMTNPDPMAQKLLNQIRNIAKLTGQQ